MTKNSSVARPLIVLAAIAVAAPLAAQSPLIVNGHNIVQEQPGDPDTIHVSYGDLNLATATDKVLLHSRVKRAAHRTCGAIYDGAFLPQRWACEDIVWRVAGPQITSAIERAGTEHNLADRVLVVRFARR